ncbi:hypothetical protein JCM19039_2955 [Geomicrobium sp. JCM 19039]|nr:hypothetical protein JCM19039_2955 [Geomicrobium sp. JCM 19039]
MRPNQTFDLTVDLVNAEDIQDARAVLQFDTDQVTLDRVHVADGTYDADEESVTLTMDDHAVLTFDVDRYVSEDVVIELTEAQVNDAVFFYDVFEAPANPPLTLEIDGRSIGTPTELTVTDRDGKPVEGVRFDVGTDPTRVEAIANTWAFTKEDGEFTRRWLPVRKGTSFQLLDEDERYARVIDDTETERYVRTDAIREVDWASLPVTDRDGKVRTERLTAFGGDVRLQAVSPDGDVSARWDGSIVSALGSNNPEHVTLTWSADPATSQTVTWQASPLVDSGALEVEGTTILADSELYYHEDGEVQVFQATVEDLEPGQSYTYRVRTDENWSETSTFQTASDDDFSFLFAADSQAQTPEQFELLTALLEDFATDEHRFLMHAGDLVENGDSLTEWNYLLDAVGAFARERPLMAVLGNHDVYGDGYNTFKQLLPYAHNGPAGQEGAVSSFTYGDAEFFLLNSEAEAEEMRAQADWLEEQLQTSDATWTIAMFHRPAYSSNPLTSGERTADIFAPVLEQGGVDLVLMGHDHSYMRTHPMVDGNVADDGGTVYVIGGSAGPKFYPGVSYEYTDVLYDDNEQVIVSFAITNDHIRLEAMNIHGETVDEYVIEK